MAAATSFAIAAAAIAAAGAVSQGVAASKQAKFASTVQQQQAERERQNAELAEEDFRRQASRDIATRRAVLGKAGVEAGRGSPLLVSEDFASETELQALRLRSGGEVRATRLQQQAALTRAKGRAARTAGFIRGGSLLVSGGGKSFGGGTERGGFGERDVSDLFGSR